MRVNLGRRGDYAVRAAVDLARHWEGAPRKTREIAASMDIPPTFLRQILAELVAQGVLASTAGPRGGYRLTRPPGDITLLGLIQAAEGPLVLDRCVLRGGPCDWTEVCPVHEAWSRAQEAFADALAATSLADLARIDQSIESGSYVTAAATHLRPTSRRGTRS